MTRRNTFRKLRTGVLVALGMVWGGCVQVWGAVSRWSWRGYPNESALRSHLKTSDNHPYITDEEIDQMTFEQCIAYHEKDHERRKDRPRWSRPRHVPGTREGMDQHN
ncbi:MAG: hypothetical protein P1U89_27520 [Verrucomicrobiales bacterium]|nr:hypothetical protein [Verrucomicrobiales bacterium]